MCPYKGKENDHFFLQPHLGLNKLCLKRIYRDKDQILYPLEFRRSSLEKIALNLFLIHFSLTFIYNFLLTVDCHIG